MDDILYLQISESRIEQIRHIIVEILRESKAKCGLLIDSSGHLLIRKGFTLMRDVETLAVLIAANRATTRAIAEILGQDQVSVIFHQGNGDHVHITDIGERAILTLLFDERADLGRINEIAAVRVKQIEALLEPDEAEAGNEEIQDLSAQADKKLDEILAAEESPEEDAAAG